MSDEVRVVPVILSGGMGSRMWPLSRKTYPKQFLNLHHPELAVIQETALRVGDRSTFSPPIFVCNEEHRFLVAEKMHAIGIHDMKVILEPTGRNTAPAIALAAHVIAEESGAEEVVMLILPSDHIIDDTQAFLDGVTKAVNAAKQGYLTTFGITPNYADTGYGYIHYGAKIRNVDARKVEAFKEKPNTRLAEKYVKSGEYAWNSGMFVFPLKLFLQELESYQPDIALGVRHAAQEKSVDADFIRVDKNLFAQVPGISVDYAVMEHTKHAAVIPLNCGWNDAGTWESLWRIKEKDNSNNVTQGIAYLRDCNGCYIACDDGTHVAGLGLQNMIVVSTKDCVLVATKDKAQEVKQLVEQVQKESPELVDEYRQMYRPWGHYDSIDSGKRHQVKRITVKPGEKLSLQMHYHRSEHWVVVSGTAEVVIDDMTMTITENESVYIPSGAKHRLRNPGKIPLEIIEVQSGPYLGEDDIVRFEDQYGRIQ